MQVIKGDFELLKQNMVDLHDIRPGNQVLHVTSGSIVTILKIENDKVLLDTFPQSSFFHNTNITGIPLTTAMLKKMAFTNDGEISTWSGQGISIHIKDDGFFYGLRILKSRAKIQFLHQLQNYIADFYSVFKQQTRSLNLNSLFYT